MKFRKSLWLMAVTMLSVILSSCNLGATPAPTQDVGAIQTQAFNLVLTQIALQSSPTPLPTNTTQPTTTLAALPTFAPVGGGTVTPFAFNTPLPGLGLTPLASPVSTAGAFATITTKNGCNDGVMIGESAPYDGQVLKPGQYYEKHFDFANIGTCTWDEGYAFIFQPAYSSPKFLGGDIKIQKPEDFTSPGERITFVMKLVASNVPGEHIGSWKMRDDGGNYFGSLVYVKYVIGTKAEQEAAKEAAQTAAADD
jgi:hypothetical protein